jgi:hypothetical protein
MIENILTSEGTRGLQTMAVHTHPAALLAVACASLRDASVAWNGIDPFYGFDGTFCGAHERGYVLHK